MSSRVGGCGALLAGLLVWAAPVRPAGAQAADPPAVAHFKAGRKHYQLSEYADALREFREGFRNREDPVFLYNIAQCHRMLGDSREALTYYRRYLAANPAAENRDEVEKLVHGLEQSAAQQPVAPPPAPVMPAPTPPPAVDPAAPPSPPPPSPPAWPFAPAQGGAPASPPPGPPPVAAAPADFPPSPPGPPFPPPGPSPSMIGSAAAAVPPVAEQGKPVRQQLLFWAILGGVLVAVGTVLFLSRPGRADPCQGIAPCRTLY